MNADMTNTANIFLPTGSIPVVRPARIRASEPPFPWVGLITLSAAVFLSVTSEMLPTGLLPEMSGSLGVA